MKISLVYLTVLVCAHQLLLTTTTATPIPQDPSTAAAAAVAAAAAAIAQGQGQGGIGRGQDVPTPASGAPLPGSISLPPASGFIPDPPQAEPPGSGDASRAGEEGKGGKKKNHKKRDTLSGEDYMKSHSLVQALEDTNGGGASDFERGGLYERSSMGIRTVGQGGELKEEVESSTSSALS